jgi:hypothetical protein
MIRPLNKSLLFFAIGWSVCLPLMAEAANDECSFIREKIANLPHTGGEVVIPSGVYTCFAPIVLDRNHTSLRGEGEVTLILGKNVNAPVLVMGEIATPPRPIRNVQVVNLKIDGNRWHQKFECWGGPCDGGGNSFIRNNGITVRAVTNGRIQDVSVTGARSGGIVTEKGCFDLDIDNFTATDNEFDGFAGYETVGARLTRLYLHHNRAAGISLDIRFHGNFFRDVRIENNGDVGIFMRDSNSNIFEDVVITDSGSHGVFLAHAGERFTCSLDNQFVNLAVSRSRGVGFLLNNACEGNRLIGTSQFKQNRDGCVSEADGARLKIGGFLICEQ